MKGGDYGNTKKLASCCSKLMIEDEVGKELRAPGWGAENNIY
jgi:hypothetical protein